MISHLSAALFFATEGSWNSSLTLFFPPSLPLVLVRGRTSFQSNNSFTFGAGARPSPVPGQTYSTYKDLKTRLYKSKLGYKSFLTFRFNFLRFLSLVAMPNN